MGIVTSFITEDRLQAGNRRSIRELHTDHLGNQYPVTYMVDVGFDINVKLASRATEIEANLAQSEIDNYIGDADEGIEIDPATVPDHAVKADILKALIKHFRVNKHITAISIIVVIDSMTDTQIKNIVGLTQVQVDKIRVRVVNLKAIRASINNDLVDIEEE